MLKIYAVGGSIRDELLGRPVKDQDFVVVGVTPQEMIDAGFEQVGADFPVFLKDGNEYALARQERKTGHGYHGFETIHDPTVTLEDDLRRRDLTINAMARDPDTNEVIDPFNGQQDLKDGILRHVSEAFAEDPVRVLRTARFAARYGFTIADETKDLMKKLVQAGELDHLTPERVWSELEKVLMEDTPLPFFWTLESCGAREVLFPELGRTFFSTGLLLNKVVLRDGSLNRRLVALCAETRDAKTMLVRLKATNDAIRLVEKYQKLLRLKEPTEITEQQMLDFFKSIDVFRRSDDFEEMIAVCDLTSWSAAIDFDTVIDMFKRIKNISFSSLTEEQQSTLKGAKIGEAIDGLRLEAIRSVLNK